MTRSRPTVLVFIAMILALAGASAVYAIPRGGPNANPGRTVSLAAVSRGCGLVHVVLRGAKAPTITCVSRSRPAGPARLAGSGPATLDTSEGCGSGNNLFIFVTFGPEYCFSGSGYLGISTIYSVGDIVAYSGSWVRLYYDGVGSYFNVPVGEDVGLWGYQSAPEPINVTQVCDSCPSHS